MECWNCDKDIKSVSNLDCFFWCNQTCKADHAEKEAKQKAKWDRAAEKAEKAFKPNGVKTIGEHVPDSRFDEKSGRKKRAKNGEVKSASATAPGKKTCGKCGVVGHNARTCGGTKEKVADNIIRRSHIVTNEKIATISTPVAEGKYKCGKCGAVGHNARTCK